MYKQVLLFLIVMSQSAAFAADAYVNGRWYDDEGFLEQTVYVADGRSTFTEPARVYHTFDLAGGYGAPAFAEAHNHDLTSNFEPRERKVEQVFRE